MYPIGFLVRSARLDSHGHSNWLRHPIHKCSGVVFFGKTPQLQPNWRRFALTCDSAKASLELFPGATRANA